MTRHDLFGTEGQLDAPAVIGPEHMGVEDDPLAEDAGHAEEPEPVFVPCRPVADGAEQAEVVVHLTDSGERVLLVFSALETLTAVMGDDQPWLSIPSPEIDALAEHVGADGIGLDIGLNAATEGDE